MRNYLKWQLILLFLIQGCSDAPNIKEQYAKDLPAHWQLESFKIEAEEQRGTKVDPVFEYRFIAEVSPKEHLHQRVGRLLDTDIVSIVVKKGTESKLHGKAHARMYQGEWHTQFNIESSPPADGSPLSAYKDKVVVQGSSDYKKLIKTTRQQLEKLEQQILQDDQRFQQGLAEYNTLSQELAEKSRLSSEQLNKQQQDYQQQRNVLYSQSRAQSQDAQQQLQAQRQQQTGVFKQQYDAAVAEVDKQHRLKIAEFSAEKTKLRQWRDTERTAARSSNNAEAEAARKSMARADYTVHKARLDEQLRSKNQEIEQSYNQQLAQVQARETEHNNNRRDKLAALNTEYRSQVDNISQQLAAQGSAQNAELNSNQKQQQEDLDKVLTSARNTHQALQNNNNQQLTAKRQELDKLQRDMAANRNSYTQQARLLQLLEPDT